MDQKQLITTLVIGLIAGLIAGIIVPTGGLITTTIVGVIGAYVGSFFFKMVGISIQTASQTVNTLITSVAGAVVFVILWNILSFIF